MRIATFNVNNVVKRLANLLEWLEATRPDVVCLQELKVTEADFPAAALAGAGYAGVWRGQRSWNGVAILSRGGAPVLTRDRLPGEADDAQARYIEAAVEGVLVGCLYAPNGMRTSLRLMLVDDGTYRVDYGAVEPGEMPLVVGYGSPDGGPVSPAAPAEHSWGAEPLGSGEQPAAGVAFGPSSPANVDHLWVRWRGYPESVASPDSPVILDPKLKKARKVTLRANGSRIVGGASLVVDGTERFPLVRSASGTKWIVGKRARSSPSNRSVADIWSDGGVHSIRVENPDGRRSQSAEL